MLSNEMHQNCCHGPLRKLEVFISLSASMKEAVIVNTRLLFGQDATENAFISVIVKLYKVTLYPPFIPKRLLLSKQ